MRINGGATFARTYSIGRRVFEAACYDLHGTIQFRVQHMDVRAATPHRGAVLSS